MIENRPRSADELAAIITDAAAAGRSLAVTGSGSRPGIGPGTADAVLDMGGMAGAIDHDAAELLLTAPVATPLSLVEAQLAAAGQCLAFEPPSPDAIWGQGSGTIGGMVAAGLSGPRRPFAGAARDHVLAISGVTGRGEIFNAGGKVLKNVTGFDLPRLLTGARGTLAALTQITLKVLPLPPGQATLQIAADTANAAVQIMADALRIDGGISGAAWADGMINLRLESSLNALPALVADLCARVPGGTVLEAAASRQLWAGIASLSGHIRPDDIVWRCPLPAPRAAELASALPAGAQVRLDWGGALVWLLLPPALADFDVHGAVARAAGREGHAMRLRLPPGITSAVPNKPALDPGLAALSSRVQALFDPAGILSPGGGPA